MSESKGRHRPGHREKRKRRRRIALLVVLAALILPGAVALVLFLSDEDRVRKRRIESARLAIEAGDEKTAVEVLGKLIREDPADTRVRQTQIGSYLRLGQIEEAAAVAREGLVHDPLYAPFHLTLSLAARRAGNLDEAIEHARAAIEGQSVPKNAPLTLADLLLEAGRESEALATLTDALGDEDAPIEIPLRLATLLSRVEPDTLPATRAQQMLERALATTRAAWEADRQDPAALERYVQMAIYAGKPGEAVVALASVLVSREHRPRERYLLARAHAAAGRRDQATEILESLGEVAPADVRPEELAAAWLLAGDPVRALACADRALESDPGDAALLRLRLRILRAKAVLPSTGEAVEGAPAVEAGDERPPPGAREVEEGASDVLRVRPKDESARASRALARLAQGRIRDALADASELRRTAPDSPLGAWIQGLALYRLGDAVSALLLLEKGRAAATPHEAARWIARAAILAGDPERAAREAGTLTGPRDTALRAAVAAARGDADGAERLIGSRPAARSELMDRLLTVGILATRGRDAPARALAGELRDGTPMEQLESARLFALVDDRDRAAGVLLDLAEKSETLRPTALSTWASLAAPPPGEKPTEELERRLARLQEVEGGRPLSLLIRARVALETDPETALREAREVAETMPGDPRGHILVLLALQATGAPGEELEAAADRVLLVAPGAPSARMVKANRILERTRDHLSRGEIREVESELDSVVELTGEAAVPVFARGLVRSMRGDLAAAEEDARLLTATKDGAGAGRYLLGLLRIRQGRYREAGEELEKASQALPDAVEVRLALGLALLGSRRPEDALEIAEGLDPDVKGALDLHSRALLALGRNEEALALLEARVSPDDARGRLRIAAVLRASGRRLEAAEKAAKISEALPDRIEPHLLEVSALLEAGEEEKALAAANRAVGKPSTRTIGLVLRAAARARAGDEAGELEDLKTAWEEAPQDPRVLRFLGARLIKDGNPAEARRLLERARKLNRGEIGARLLLADLANADGRVADAMQLWEEVLDVAPDNPVAANNLAFRLAEQGTRIPRALLLARTAVERFPDHGQFRDTYAVVLAASGRTEEAAAEAEKALALAPKDPWVALRAARIFVAAGRLADARSAAAQAEILAGGDAGAEVVKQVRALLRGISGR